MNLSLSPVATRVINAVVLVLIAVALLIPIWAVERPALLDYPNHLARNYVLANIHDPALKLEQYYRADWGPNPYLGMDISLQLLQHLFPIYLAGKIFLSFTVIAFPAACWWFLRRANPGNDWTACLVLLIVYNVLFLEGFVVYELSLAMAFFSLGWWLTYLRSPNWWKWSLMTALFTAVYFTHLVGFIVAGVVVASYVFFSRNWKQVLWSGVMFVPGVLLYVLSGIGQHNGKEISVRTIYEKVSDGLFTLFHNYSMPIETLTVWVVLGCVLFAIVRNKEFHWNHPWPAVAFTLLALYAALPLQIGQTFDVDIRVMMPLFVVSLAAAKIGRRQVGIAAIALALFFAKQGSITERFIYVQPDLAAWARSFDYIAPHSRVLPMVQMEEEDDPIHRPYAHFWAYAVIDKQVFSPYLFDLKGQTPMRIVHDVYSPDGFWDLDYNEIIRWKQIQDDYDYVWAYDVGRFARPLQKIGKPIYQSGALVLYRITRQNKKAALRQPGKPERENP